MITKLFIIKKMLRRFKLISLKAQYQAGVPLPDTVLSKEPYQKLKGELT